MSANSYKECVIVGAGLIGLLTARVLAREGLRVTVIEKACVGGESSWAGGGILSPLYPWRYADAVNRLARWSQYHYAGLAAELTRDSDIDPEWEQNGLLILDRDELSQMHQWAQRYDFALERFGNDAMLIPEIAHIRNPRLLKAIRKSVENLGVVLREGAQVTDISIESCHVRGVVVGDEMISADCVVVACGAWSAALLAKAGIVIDVKPVRGQMLLFKAEPGQVRHIILSQGRYVIPRRDGRVLVGSTLENVGFDKRTTADALQSLRATAFRLVPELADCELEAHWSGLRPGSPQGIPYIGRHPQVDGLYINAGHFRNGVVLGPASARLLVDIMLEYPPFIDASLFALDR